MPLPLEGEGEFAQDTKLAALLAVRAERGLLRQLSLSTSSSSMVDFSSNDYLGLAHSPDLLRDFIDRLQQLPLPPASSPSSASSTSSSPSRSSVSSSSSIPLEVWMGSSGSRLLSGNHAMAEALERRLCRFHEAPAALLFNSGFDANAGFFGCIPQPDDLVLFDELIHASVHEGMRTGRGTKVSFAHNDVSDAESRILEFRRSNAAQGRNILVVVESVYSMDGDFAPLEQLVKLCSKYNAQLVVDEAHATGLFGPNGAGLVQERGLQKHVYARLHTFGKSLGCFGAVLLCTPTARSFLVNYSRPLIYSTSLPPITLLGVMCAYDLIERTDERRDFVHRLIDRFRRNLQALPPRHLLRSVTAIQGIVLQGNDQVARLSDHLRSAGFDVKPIRSPTVPAGTERVRICLHYHNTEAQVDRLCERILHFFESLTTLSFLRLSGTKL